MHETGVKLFNLMFREGENVCVSNSEYAYHSVYLSSAIGDKVKLVSPNPNNEMQEISTDDLTLVALNPITGWRKDEYCTAFRNFLIEMDYGPLPEQLAYAKAIGLPYSAVVFSGNKSLHFLISLDQDLPSEEVWRTMAEWTLAIATAADQNTKNPSRQIRIPGAYRGPGKKQLMVENKGATGLKDFAAWLAQHPNAKPRPPEKRTVSGSRDFSKIKPWVSVRLAAGIVGQKSGRNKEWFAIAVEFAIAGYSEDETILVLEEFFTPDRDFKRKEWLTALKSGHKYANTRKQDA
ncbi:MAG: hypothetical protein HC840_00950 [Leptolyngbyaceae cyanobacterium RM2_2_4]|nr:hypothetical protein [Leptolyngbyaceae cyanobacterium RM2_2_4]